MSRSRTFKAALLASGTLLTSLVGLVSAMILVRLLSQQDYGTYSQTLLAYNFVSPLLMAGLPTALFFFLPRNPQRSRGILVENLLGLTLLGVGFALFLALGGNRLLAERTGEPNPDLVTTLMWFAPYAIFVLPAASLASALMSMDHYREVAVYNCVSRLVMLGVAVGACLIHRSPVAAVIGQVAGAAIVLPAALVLMLRACREGSWRPTWSGLRRQLAYSIPVGLTRGFAMFRIQLDKLLIAGLYDASQYAVYATGAVELPLVGVLSTSVTGVLLPETTRLTEQGRRREAAELWQRAGEKSALIVFPLTVFFYVMAPEVMTVLFSAAYEASAAPFRVYTLQLPLRIVNVSNMFFTVGRTAPVMWIHLATLVVNALVSLVLVRWLGPVGAAWGSLLSLALCLYPLGLWWIVRNYGLTMGTVLPLKRLGLIAAACLAAGVVLLVKPLLADVHAAIALTVLGAMYAGGVALLYDRTGLVPLRALRDGLKRHL